MRRWSWLLCLLISLVPALTLAGTPPLPVRSLVREAVAPFPGGGVAPAYLLRAGQPGAAEVEADRAQDRATEAGPGVRRVLREVGDDPYAAYRWVRNNVEYEPYHGVKRGAEGVAWERVGNGFDQAALLASLLRAQGVACRFVYGVVRVEAKRFAAWCGVATEEEAYRLAVGGGMPVRAIRVGGRIEAVEVSHCWLEAHLPYFNPGYRGPGERIWVPLDPSYKAHDVTLGVDLFPRLGFQEEEFLIDYLATPRDVSPQEAFRDLLRGKLGELGMAGGLVQASWRVRVVPEGSGELPTDLPPGLEVLGIVWERANVPEVYHYRLRLTLWDGVDDGKGVTAGDLRVEIPTAYLASRRLTLVYRPAGAEDQALADASPTRSPRDSTVAGRIRWKPVLLVDGTPLGEALPGELTDAAAPGAAEGGNVGTSQTLLVETLYAGADPGAVDRPPGSPDLQFGYAQARVIVGEDYALVTEVGLVTAERIAHLAGELQTLREDGTPEEVLSSTLSLAALQYLHRTGLAARGFARLLGIRFLEEPSLVLCGVHMGAGEPFFDVISLVSAIVSRDGRADRERAFLCLWGLESSFQEHKVLEDVFRTTAVSTVRLLKRARELGLPPVVVDRSNVEAELGRLLSLGPDGERIRGEVMEGRKVMFPPERLTLERWTGTGYLVWEPATWYGAYMISGRRGGGNCSGQPPGFLVGLWNGQLGGTRFAVVHTLWADPDLPGDVAADVTLIDLADSRGPVLAAALILPEGFPLASGNAMAGQAWGDFRLLPSLFAVGEAMALRAAGLWIDPATPGEATLRWASLGQPGDPSPGMPVGRISWARWDGSAWGQAVEASTVSSDAPLAGARERLRVEVTSAQGDVRTGHATLLGLWPSDALEQVVPPAQSGTALFHGPPDAAGATTYAPDDKGEVLIPYDQLALWSLDDAYVTVGIVAEGRVIGYDLRSLTQPGTYVLLLTDRTGIPRRVRLLVGGIELVVDADNDNGFGTEFDADDRRWGNLPPDADHPGKIVGFSRGDSDGDGIPDFADGFDRDGVADSSDDLSADPSHRFVPVRVTVDIGTYRKQQGAGCKLRFLYGAPGDAAKTLESQVEAVPHPVEWQQEEVTTYSLREPPPLRLWTADAAHRRSKIPLPKTGEIGAGEYVDPQGEGRYVAPHTDYPLSSFFDSASEAPATRVFYVEGLVESGTPGTLSLGVELVVDSRDGATSKGWESRLSHGIHMTALGVDVQMYSRNNINLLLEDRENELWEDAEPFVFWVNDNNDRVEHEKDDSVPLTPDGHDTAINGVGDLLDLAPFALRPPAALKAAELPAGFAYRLVLRNAQEGKPAIRVFPDAGYRQYRQPAGERPYAYLRDSGAAADQVGAPSVFGGVPLGSLSTDQGGTIPAADLVEQRWLVFEGVEPGRAQLQLQLIDTKHGGAVVAADSAWLLMPAAPPLPAAGQGEVTRSVHGLISEWNLRSDGWGGWGDDLPVREQVQWVREPSATAKESATQYVFYVHGFNERPGETRVLKFGPVFQRLYWAGVRVHPYQGGLFVGVHWPGDEGYLMEQGWYNRDVFHAFYAGDRFGENLKSEVGSRTGTHVNIVAHSLGTVVAGQALTHLAKESFGPSTALFAVQGAVTASAFDSPRYKAAERPGGYLVPMPGKKLTELAMLTGFRPPGDEVPADRMWQERWAAPAAAFASEDPCPMTAANYPDCGGFYTPWNDATWRTQWTLEAPSVVRVLGGVAEAAYEKRWSHDEWRDADGNADNDPWGGIFGSVTSRFAVHNFTSNDDEGGEIDEVLRWWPETFTYYKDWFPLGNLHPAWRLNQEKMRPETFLPADHDDPDGGDSWDEDLLDNPDRVEAGVWSTPEGERECRHRAELAHYFNELAMPVAVNNIAGLPVENHTLRDLLRVMKGYHDYFVRNKEYHLVYPQLWGPMAGTPAMLQTKQNP